MQRGEISTLSFEKDINNCMQRLSELLATRRTKETGLDVMGKTKRGRDGGRATERGRERRGIKISKRKKGRRKSGRAQRLALARTAPRPLMGADGRSLPGTWNPIASLSQSQSRRVSRSRLRRGFLPFPPSVQVSGR